MDRTLINLASILIGGAGLFTVLTGFNVPEVHGTYYEKNPFAIKRDAIEEVTAWMFSCVALLALLLQLFAEIVGERLPARSHSAPFYGSSAVAGLALVACVVWLLGRVSRHLARGRWLSQVLDTHAANFADADFILTHDFYREDEIPHLHEYSQRYCESRQKRNLEDVREIIGQQEKLFDVPAQGELASRVERLRAQLARDTALLTGRSLFRLP